VPRLQILQLGWYGRRSESAPYFGATGSDSEARLGTVLAGLFISPAASHHFLARRVQ
jgi:hypothetical protein